MQPRVEWRWWRRRRRPEWPPASSRSGGGQGRWWIRRFRARLDQYVRAFGHGGCVEREVHGRRAKRVARPRRRPSPRRRATALMVGAATVRGRGQGRLAAGEELTVRHTVAVGSLGAADGEEFDGDDRRSRTEERRGCARCRDSRPNSFGAATRTSAAAPTDTVVGAGELSGRGSLRPWRRQWRRVFAPMMTRWGWEENDLAAASGCAREYLSARRLRSVAVAAIARLIAVEHLCVLDSSHGDEQ